MIYIIYIFIIIRRGMLIINFFYLRIKADMTMVVLVPNLREMVLDFRANRKVSI